MRCSSFFDLIAGVSITWYALGLRLRCSFQFGRALIPPFCPLPFGGGLPPPVRVVPSPASLVRRMGGPISCVIRKRGPPDSFCISFDGPRPNSFFSLCCFCSDPLRIIDIHPNCIHSPSPLTASLINSEVVLRRIHRRFAFFPGRQWYLFLRSISLLSSPVLPVSLSGDRILPPMTSFFQSQRRRLWATPEIPLPIISSPFH